MRFWAHFNFFGFQTSYFVQHLLVSSKLISFYRYSVYHYLGQFFTIDITIIFMDRTQFNIIFSFNSTLSCTNLSNHNYKYYSSFFTYFIINTNSARIYTNQYGLASGTVGLCYVGMAVGAIIGGLGTGRVSDAAYRKQVAKIKNKEEIQAEMRLTTPIFYASIVLSLFCFIAFGWCTEMNVHYAAGLLCRFFCMGHSFVL